MIAVFQCSFVRNVSMQTGLNEEQQAVLVEEVTVLQQYERAPLRPNLPSGHRKYRNRDVDDIVLACEMLARQLSYLVPPRRLDYQGTPATG